MDFILRYWLQVLFGIVLSVAGYLYKNGKKLISTIEKNENAIKGIVEEFIVWKFEEYVKRDGITLSEKEHINNLYFKYRLLSNNGFIDDLMYRINEMKIVS